MSTFEERQRQRRAAGTHNTADLLERLPPALRAYAEDRVLAAPGPTVPNDPLKARAELRQLLGAMRMQGNHRRLDTIAPFLAAEPDHPHAAYWRGRTRDLLAERRALERCGLVAPRPWGRIPVMEAKR